MRAGALWPRRDPLGAVGPQGPPYPEFWQHEKATDQPQEWSRSDRAVLLLVIVGTVIALAIVFSFFM